MRAQVECSAIIATAKCKDLFGVLNLRSEDFFWVRNFVWTFLGLKILVRAFLGGMQKGNNSLCREKRDFLGFTFWAVGHFLGFGFSLIGLKCQPKGKVRKRLTLQTMV